jgi:ankyrin repeat protein
MLKKTFPVIISCIFLIFGQTCCKKHELTLQEKNLFEQLISGNSAEIAHLIEAGANIQIKDHHGNTPLHIVASRGDCESIKLLINKRAKINSTNDNGDTPLHEAADNGRLEAAKLLIEKGANVNAKNKQNKTPIFPAAQSGNLDLVKLLVEKGAKIQTTGYTPLHDALINPSLRHKPENNLAEMIEYFLSKGVDVNAKDDNYMATPLYLAADDSDKEAINLFIEKGAIVDIRTKNGETPLCNAAVGGNFKSVGVLLDNGANVNARDKRDYTPLHYALLIRNTSKATMSDRLEVIKLLLAQGADINARDNNQYTPLFNAIQLGMFYQDMISSSDKGIYLTILKTLLENGADPNIMKIAGRNLLLEQAEEEPEIIELLIKYGAKKDNLKLYDN